VGEKPCCGQSGKISHATHICPATAPACSGYEHSVKFGKCVSHEEAKKRAKEDKLARVGDVDDEGGGSAAGDDDAKDGEEGGWNGTESAYAYYGNASAAYNWSSSDYGMRSSSHLETEIRLIVQLLRLRPGPGYTRWTHRPHCWLARGCAQALWAWLGAVFSSPAPHEPEAPAGAASRALVGSPPLDSGGQCAYCVSSRSTSSCVA